MASLEYHASASRRLGGVSIECMHRLPCTQCRCTYVLCRARHLRESLWCHVRTCVKPNMLLVVSADGRSAQTSCISSGGNSNCRYRHTPLRWYRGICYPPSGRKLVYERFPSILVLVGMGHAVYCKDPISEAEANRVG